MNGRSEVRSVFVQGSGSFSEIVKGCLIPEREGVCVASARKVEVTFKLGRTTYRRSFSTVSAYGDVVGGGVQIYIWQEPLWVGGWSVFGGSGGEGTREMSMGSDDLVGDDECQTQREAGVMNHVMVNLGRENNQAWEDLNILNLNLQGLRCSGWPHVWSEYEEWIWPAQLDFKPLRWVCELIKKFGEADAYGPLDSVGVGVSLTTTLESEQCGSQMVDSLHNRANGGLH